MGQKNNILMVNYQQKIFINPENESSNILKKFLQSLIKKKKAQSLLLKVVRLVQMMQPTKPKYEVFTQAVKNIQPSFEFKRARLGGLYQMIPGAKNLRNNLI
jgi:ribosomal protein S7